MTNKQLKQAKQNQAPFWVPDFVNDEYFQHELVIDRSRFICVIGRCASVEQAKKFIQRLKDEYPDARHHCYAYVAGRPDDSQCHGFSDDGEPSGTAGKPMLLAVQGSGLGEVCAVVVRYFGGIKLGTGGLQRAYGGSVRETLAQLKTTKVVPQQVLPLICAYDQLSDVKHFLIQYQGQVINEDFGAQVMLELSLPISEVEAFRAHLFEHFNGQLLLPEAR